MPYLPRSLAGINTKNMEIMKFKQIVGILLIGFSFMACNQSGKDNQSAAEASSSQVSNVNYKIGDHVPNELVCMVNNAYMGENQMPVPVEGKTYYGCCEMCVQRLNEDESSRLGSDPYSGNEVDKSEAFIVISGENGKVEYFESPENFESYRSM